MDSVNASEGAGTLMAAAQDHESQTLSPLRVLVICYEYPPAGGGGGRVAASVAKGLVRKGHEVRVLTSHVKGLNAEERIEGVSVRRAFAGRRRLDRCTIPEMGLYVLAQAAPAIAEIRRFRPDVIHVHFAVPSGPVAWIAGCVTKTPYVLTAHLGDVPGGVPEQTDGLFKYLKPLTVPIWRDAAAATAVASHVAGLANAAYGICPEVVLNGIDMKLAPKRKRQSSKDPLRLIWCGRIQEQKNLGPGLEALGSISGMNWTLDIIGDGPLRSDVEARCKRVGLDPHVSFHPWLPSAKVASALAAADVLFLPSLSEGLSLVTVESLRAQLAFVASRIPGVRDVVIDGENGFLCDPSQPQAFAEAIARLVQDRDELERMQRASAKRIRMFDEEQMIGAYEKILRLAARHGAIQ